MTENPNLEKALLRDDSSDSSSDDSDIENGVAYKTKRLVYKSNQSDSDSDGESSGKSPKECSKGIIEGILCVELFMWSLTIMFYIVKENKLAATLADQIGLEITTLVLRNMAIVLGCVLLFFFSETYAVIKDFLECVYRFTCDSIEVMKRYRVGLFMIFLSVCLVSISIGMGVIEGQSHMDQITSRWNALHNIAVAETVTTDIVDPGSTVSSVFCAPGFGGIDCSIKLET